MKTRNLISLLFAAIIVVSFTACGGGGTKAEKQPEATVMADADHAHLHYIQVAVEGMTCEGCQNTVKGAITKVAGVDSAMASFTDGRAFAGYAATTPDTAALRTAITEAGYKVTGFAFISHDLPEIK
jgi:copper chaperone CopZ